MPEIRIETVNDFVLYRHTAFTWCPGCNEHRDLDLARLIRLGLGERTMASIRIRCRRCSERFGELVLVKILTPGPRPPSERQRPDNVVPLGRKPTP
jgi:hypothetical protein